MTTGCGSLTLSWLTLATITVHYGFKCLSVSFSRKNNDNGHGDIVWTATETDFILTGS